MKTNWQTKKLGEVCDFQNGFAFKSKLFKETGFPVLRISNIQNDGISYNRLVFFDKKNYKEDFDKYQVLKGDLVIAMSGATTGKLAICNADEVFYLNQRVGKFKPKKDLSKDYLYYFLSTRVEENLRISAGSAQPNLSTEQIRDFEIPFTPLPEQHRIVKILDEVFDKVAKAKENAEKNLQNSKEIFESYLQNVFANPGKNWEEVALGNFLKLEYGKPLDKKDRKANGEYPVYGANGEKSRTDKFYYNKPTIIIGRKGSAGELNLTENKFWPLDVTYFVTFDNKKYNLKFVYFLLSTLKLTRLAKGVKPGINRNDVYLINVFVPNLREQKAIVKKLDALSVETKKLEAIYKQKLADLEELKKSVLKKAFRGEL